MFVYPVAYRIRSDNVLVKDIEITKGLSNLELSFDGFYQYFSTRYSYHHQFDDKLIYGLRNQTFSMFFCFEKGGKLHLFNSRSEVTRFLRS